MLFRNAATTAVGVIALAVAGAAMGPQWDPAVLTDPLMVQSASTAIGGPAHTTRVGTYPVVQHIVRVQLDGAAIDARITAPVGAPAGLPGVVFIHGAGTGKYTRAFEVQAHDLATAGIVTMVPNKRLDTYSTSHRDYEAMARDYARSVAVLRATPGVAADRVGVYGESEGGWIAPVMTANDPRLAFAVLISAPVVPPREQAAFAADSYLRHTGVPQGVFRAIPRALGLAFPGGAFAYADFNVTPFQRRTTQPVFMAYGTSDASMPTVQGAQQVIADLAVAGNDQFTLRYYDGANHGIRVGARLAPNFVPEVTRWINGLPATATAPPRIAGEQPRQEYLAAPVPTPRWFGNGDTVLFTAIGSGAAIVLGAAVWIVAWRLRRRRLAAGLMRPLFALAIGAVLTVGALVWYLVAITRIALDYSNNAWVVQGGWIGVRLLGIAAVAAGATLVNRLADVRKDPEARAVPGAAGGVVLGLVGAASVMLLVLLAYWGVFQLGI